MRHYDRIQCLGVIDYNAGGIIISARCQKDCRHGHATKRQGFLFHRVDVHLADGAHVKLTWDGIGIMPPEVVQRRIEMQKRPPQKQGRDAWGGDDDA